MLESGTRNGSTTKALDRLGDAVAVALDSGITEEELTSMVDTAVASYQSGVPGFPGSDPDMVYDISPLGLIDLPTAARKYDLNRTTLNSWVFRGRLQLRGRLKGPAARGGFILIREDDLVALLAMPKSKGGRPRKKPPQYRNG